jgi:Zn-dependent metalloprotease
MVKRILLGSLFLLAGMALLAAAPVQKAIIPGVAPLPGPAASSISPERARQSAEASAASLLQSSPEMLGIVDPDNAFVMEGTDVDAHGASHVRFRQTYKGVPVFEREVVVHVANDSAGVFAIGNASEQVPAMSVTPALQEGEAIRQARNSFKAFFGQGKTRAESRLVIYPDCAGYHLAYEVKLSNVMNSNLDPAEWIYFVDADNGAILDGWNNLHTKGKPGSGGGGLNYTTPVIGTGKTLYSGNVSLGTAQASDGSSNFAMKDLVRAPMYASDLNNRTNGTGTMFTATSNTWGNNSSSNRATAGADAHYGAEMTYDFYKNTFGRSGIDGSNMSTYSRVHYGRNYNNAFWSDSCKCMTYGDGDGNVLSPLVSLDVAGHEMSHGVTARTSNLSYSGESGGLNESFSDIMGTGVEFYAAAHGASKTANYWIGEDVYTPSRANDALRYMDDPTKDGASIDNYSRYTSSLDVHYSSGIWNNVFYLMAHGGTNRTSGTSVTGIGLDKALQVCYLANTGYFSSGETFHQARLDSIAAATQLYGASSTEVTRVGQAWAACGVN